MKAGNRLLVAGLATLGMFGGHSISAAVNQASRQVAVSAATNAREIRSDSFGGIGSGLLDQVLRQAYTAKDWGMSRACARMVRKNKLRRRGLGGQKI